MYEIVKITLENPMDLVLAQKKTSRLGERLKLAISTQTTFSTAVVEVCREVIDRTDDGLLILGVLKEDIRFSLVAQIRYTKDITIIPSDIGIKNAQKLVPFLDQYQENECEVIELRLGLPRQLQLKPEGIQEIAEIFATEKPFTAYEAIKLKNIVLQNLAEEKEEELIQSRLDNEQKSEFISIASHELKTPVTVIRAYAQMMLNMGEQHCSKDFIKHLRRIESQSERLSLLIQQLLDVSKIEQGKLEYRMEETDLNSFVTETVGYLTHTTPDHTIEIDLDTTALVCMDKMRMEQVLSNIIGNAAKYSSVGSTIKISSSTAADVSVISVQDSGIGMSKTDLSRIFEKFQRSRDVINKFSGLGMGLYISSQIMKEHRGSIWVESKEGEGSTFHFSLPHANIAKVVDVLS